VGLGLLEQVPGALTRQPVTAGFLRRPSATWRTRASWWEDNQL
jgi:hypothetical protein